MQSWWIRFADRKPASVYGSREEAEALGAEAGHVLEIVPIGYPAVPRLDARDGWGKGEFPSFCTAPESCSKGGYCVNPHGRSCTS